MACVTSWGVKLLAWADGANARIAVARVAQATSGCRRRIIGITSDALSGRYHVQTATLRNFQVSWNLMERVGLF